jgi:LmbE family N-acetylglucosaminyl deacetylase
LNVLVVAAHPDDEVLGCGATMKKLADEGHTVSVVILGEGITSRFDSPDAADPESLRALHDKAVMVNESLGAKDVVLERLPDNRFDSVPLLDIVKIVERHVQRVQPEQIYTHWAGDLNIDHHLTARAVLTATRPMSPTAVREILSFEIHSSSEWAFGAFTGAFHPNVFTDVQKFVDAKIAAMVAYGEELRQPPHPRSAEVLKASAARWGSYVGLGSAEAFQLLRGIRR